MLKRYVNHRKGESKLAVRSIKRILLRRKSGKNGKAEPEYIWRRQQAVLRAWRCGTVLPRRRGDGMSAQYPQELGRSHTISEARSWNIAGVQSSGGITRKGKAEAMWCEKSEEAIVPMTAETT